MVLYRIAHMLSHFRDSGNREGPMGWWLFWIVLLFIVGGVQGPRRGADVTPPERHGAITPCSLNDDGEREC
jgi:hypothetical protein